jgi:hypothetical protein
VSSNTITLRGSKFSVYPPCCIRIIIPFSYFERYYARTVAVLTTDIFIPPRDPNNNLELTHRSKIKHLLHEEYTRYFIQSHSLPTHTWYSIPTTSRLPFLSFPLLSAFPHHASKLSTSPPPGPRNRSNSQSAPRSSNECNTTTTAYLTNCVYTYLSVNRLMNVHRNP